MLDRLQPVPKSAYTRAHYRVERFLKFTKVVPTEGTVHHLTQLALSWPPDFRIFAKKVKIGIEAKKFAPFVLKATEKIYAPSSAEHLRGLMTQKFKPYIQQGVLDLDEMLSREPVPWFLTADTSSPKCLVQLEGTPEECFNQALAIVDDYRPTEFRGNDSMKRAFLTIQILLYAGIKVYVRKDGAKLNLARVAPQRWFSNILVPGPYAPDVPMNAVPLLGKLFTMGVFPIEIRKFNLTNFLRHFGQGRFTNREYVIGYGSDVLQNYQNDLSRIDKVI